MASVDVVIPTRDTRDLTLACVESLGSEDVHCVVVDNASSDGTAEALERDHPEVTVVRNAENAGFARASNQGAHAGSAEFVLFLNSDTVADPGAVERLADFLRTQSDYAAAGGHLVDVGTRRTQVGFTVRAFPTLSTQVALMLGFERLWPGNPVSRRQLMLDFDYERTQEAEQPAGACLMCRRNALEAIGGFDEEFHYWFEDVDLVRRLRAHGRTAYVHDAIFEHVGGATFTRWERPEVIESRYRGLLRYFGKHHSRSEQAALGLTVFLLGALRGLAWLPFDRARATAYRRAARMGLGSALRLRWGR